QRGGGGLALGSGVPAEVEQPGRALRPAGQALATLRGAEAAVLLLESAPGRVRVAGEEAEYDLASPDPTRLPPVEPFPAGACHRVGASDLCRALKGTLFATGQPTSRYALHAARWESDSDRVRLVAPDNRRLAVAEMPATAHGSNPTPAQRLLPTSALKLLAKLAADVETPVSVLFGTRQAFFQAGMATLRARYVEGGFPNWRKVLASRGTQTSGAGHIVAGGVGPFLSWARQAAAVREREGGRLVLRFEPGRVLLESRRQGAGRARVRQSLPLSGAVVEVAVNPRYLIDLLSALEPDSTLLLSVTGPGEPVLASDGDGYRHLLVPLRPAPGSDRRSRP